MGRDDTMEKERPRSPAAALWRRKWIVVVMAILALGVSATVSVVRTPEYRATALLVRDRGSADVTLFGTAIYQSGDVQRDLVTTGQAIDSERVAGVVKQSTGSSRSVEKLVSMVTTEPSTDSNTIEVQVIGPDPVEAAALADAFATEAIHLRQEADKAALVLARQALEAQIALMTPADLESSLGRELQARVGQLTILEQLQTGGYSLWQPAQAPLSPISPQPVRDGVAGLAVGLVLGLIVALATDRADRRLKDDADFEREFRLPILALIPQVGRKWKRDGENVNGHVGFSSPYSAALESYRLLRSNLQYFEVEKGLRTILVTSGLPQEAKTVTATNLALSLAISGARVVLIDSDLRNPLMHRYLHLDNDVGLSTVLAGAARVEDAVKRVKTSDFLPEQVQGTRYSPQREQALQKDFLCLTSGPLPPNPAELLASPRMGEILKTLGTLADHLLIDSAPVLSVADAVSLASRVDGVIVVSRASSATIDQAHEIRNILDRVGARLIGLVVTGVKNGGKRAYDQGYYQQDS
ncbi:MAG: hypothetical protein A2W26_13690 [Acidobacteria bacterium RBG_16_64_8]|nr:MAG: hypothetical protein A2W26_13690 [Acidobacteria bacterium RBG_16_64_8]